MIRIALRMIHRDIYLILKLYIVESLNDGEVNQYLYKKQYKTNALPIFMYQMRISTNKVSSVMLRPKKLEIQNKNM
jgi:hypothetical protein